MEKKANRLIREKSPYLLQHAENPVDWYPWSREALERAKREDKPVLVSIGYSTCHWCHVMERESYEDEETARVMNENFINIKVDREERPDLDSLYMKAVQTLTGHAGWPLNVFTTPGGEPFYGGTYFPPEDRMGLPSFKKVLLTVSSAYREVRGQITEITREIAKALGEGVPAPLELAPGISESAFEAGKFFFDPVNGGFGVGMKFPHAMYLKFLLLFHKRTGNSDALQILKKTLGSMEGGGVYDHLGGGFHRYSVDERWDVPHFEKMLYDNSLLLEVYSMAYGVTGMESYRDTALGVLGYMMRDLRSPEGGFYSAQDADVDGVEGEYYAWSLREVMDVLGEERGRAFAEYFSMTDEGNFEGKNTLRINPQMKEGPPREDIRKMKDLLFKVRSLRKAPDVDRKIIASWNGLAITSLVAASIHLKRPDLLEEAKKTASFILKDLRDEKGRLHRYFLDGRSASRGNLEDYALLGVALLALVQAGEKDFLGDTEGIASSMIELFYDSGQKRFFDAGKDQERLFVRERDLSDNDVPSGNSAAAGFLLRLSGLTGKKEFRVLSEEILRSIEGMKDEPLSHGYALSVLEALLGETAS